MSDRLNQAFAKEEDEWLKKAHEEMPNIPSHERNTNQKHVKIPLHSC
jgi:hypothetical protein